MTVSPASRGFTLIELLITLAILSMVMFSGTYAYQFISQNWERNKQSYESALHEYQSSRLSFATLLNTSPKLVRSGEDIGFYFLGRDNGFTAYSLTAVQDPDSPAIYRLFQEPDPEHAGKLQLVYEEAVLNDTVLTHPEQTLNFNYRVVLQRDLTSISWSYYGWQNFAQRLEATSEFAPPGLERTWRGEHDGFSTREHPVIIRVNIDGFLMDIEVPDRGQDLTNQLTPYDT